MGFFSWITQDTGKSISNNASERPTFEVTMSDDKGNKWHESNYEGYGVFGGKDFYELVAEMNGKKTNVDGINLVFGKEPYLSPNLTESRDWEWKDEKPKTCEFQGFFYDEQDFMF